MIASVKPARSDVARFRTKLFLAMMVVVCAIASVALYLTQRSVASAAQKELQRDFQGELAALHNVQELRHAALAERCRALVRKPRIHAALEDNALDLLYPSAKDELRDIMDASTSNPGEEGDFALRAIFYRFLDRNGALIPAPNATEVGRLAPEEEAQLSLNGVPVRQQLGYLVRDAGAPGDALLETFAVPILSTETGEAIAALVLGFRPASVIGREDASGIRRGLWLNGRLYFDQLPAAEHAVLAAEVTRLIGSAKAGASGFSQQIAGAAHFLFYKLLNPGSAFAPTYEVCVYPLVELEARQRELRWQVLGAAAIVLLLGFVASQVLAQRFSKPVEELAVDAAENLTQRERVEAALELTNEELQRAARFSADASHQLKTPVTVLRAGLEELLARENLSAEECHEVSALIHQTYRLSNVIEDLLLLSRMDAGRLKIEFGSVDLTQLIEAALDDLGVQTDGLDLTIETDFPPGLFVQGEKRYLSLILQNLLENSRKYNRPGGRIQIDAKTDADVAFLTVRNTGRPIPVAGQVHIFERFHRASIGENVPGYGLGLNLARELARLHGGDLRLLRSDEEWTEFQVSFRLAHGERPAL